jgi:predicted alpha/beta-hydrolase family hydrolase
MNRSMSELLRNGPSGARARVLLAHGAGAAMDSPFMNAVAEGLADEGLGVVRFEFPYMAERRAHGKRRAPDRQSLLMQAFADVIAELGGGSELVIGGKSMGGRIASMIADELGARGLLALGYPFHPPGKPSSLRTRHLVGLRTAALFIQGTRDRMGTREEVQGYPLSDRIEWLWIEDGDHSLKPLKRSGQTESAALASAISAAATFVKGRLTE